jgi:hypothetical protein
MIWLNVRGVAAILLSALLMIAAARYQAAPSRAPFDRGQAAIKAQLPD